jgi:hypothetical protein
LGQLSDGDAVCLRAEPDQKAVAQVERALVEAGSAETPHVAEAEFLGKAGQAEHQVRVSVPRKTVRDKKQLPGHAQVNGKRRSASAAGEVKEDVLSPPADLRDPRARQPARLEVAHGRGEQSSRRYPPADEVRAEPAHDRLHLGEFGHLPSPVCCVLPLDP